MKSIRTPKYTRSDLQIMLGILIPYTLILCSILYGAAFYASLRSFAAVFLLTLLFKCFSWQFHTLTAVKLRNRMPLDAQIPRRLGTALVCFFILTAADLCLITAFYQHIHFFGFHFQPERFLYALLTGMLLNIFATLFHEGTSNFEKWKITLTETEQLKTEYLKSQVEGLKNQIRPHFLFNSINALSALIGEDPTKAEVLLNEMCKVYRYLLKNDGHFVSLGNELSFITSYFYIIKARYGTAVDVQINVDPDDLVKQVPPFTLQLLLENVLHNNVISKSNPLKITISSDQQGYLSLVHSISSKSGSTPDADQNALKNIMNKFRLLGLQHMSISQTLEFRRVLIPLMNFYPAEL